MMHHDGDQIRFSVCEIDFMVSLSSIEALRCHQLLCGKKAFPSMAQTDRLLTRGLKDQQLLWKLEHSSDGPAVDISSILDKCCTLYSVLRYCTVSENKSRKESSMYKPVELYSHMKSAWESPRTEHISCWPRWPLYHLWDDMLNFVLLSLKLELCDWQTEDRQPELLMRFTFHHCLTNWSEQCQTLTSALNRAAGLSLRTGNQYYGFHMGWYESYFSMSIIQLMLMLIIAVPGAKVFSSSEVMLENSASTHLTHTVLLLDSQ